MHDREAEFNDRKQPEVNLIQKNKPLNPEYGRLKTPPKIPFPTENSKEQLIYEIYAKRRKYMRGERIKWKKRQAENSTAEIDLVDE